MAKKIKAHLKNVENQLKEKKDRQREMGENKKMLQVRSKSAISYIDQDVLSDSDEDAEDKTEA